MKRKLALFLGLITAAIILVVSLSGCISQPGVAAAGINTGGNNQGGISVSGQGKVTVTPNIATLSIAVNAQAATVADAQSQAAAAMDKVITSLTQNGIDKKDIQTQNYNIQQVYTTFGIKTPLITPTPALPPGIVTTTTVTPFNQSSGTTNGPMIPAQTTPVQTLVYQVSNTITVKIRSIDKTGAIIDAAATAGGDLIRMNSVSFSVDQPEQYYAQARELAVKDAADKAGQLAKLAGVSMGKAINISEDAVSPNYPVYYGLSGIADAKSYTTTPIVAGQTDIVINVQIEYAIQ
jgi:uncharacterized protein YggE